MLINRFGLFWSVVSLLVLLGIAVAMAMTNNPASSSTPATAPHFWQDPALRTIVIGESDAQLPRRGDILLTYLRAGSLPPEAHQATVLTDNNCAPDLAGISHCLNRLVIGESEVEVQHHHDMRTVPCLTPGEHVNIVDQETYQRLPAF